MLRLEMLPAAFGDCLWLEYGKEGATRVVVVDGGPGGTYRNALRPRIEKFAESRKGKPRIELLVATHIDNDHIVGPLELLQDETLDVEFGEVWFNGWDQIAPDQLGVNEGIALSNAIEARGLHHNTSFDGRAVMVDQDQPSKSFTFPGGLNLIVLSPGPKQVDRLRDKWKKVLAEAAGETPEPDDALGADAPDVEALAAKKFKPDYAPANGSSIVLLAEYDGHSLLLAADSFAPVVAASLRGLGYSEVNRLRLDAYKMSHHGSRGNNSSVLLRCVSCHNYLFSTSGARFHHPHDECVARVLVDGGKGVRIHSNYRRDEDMLWNVKEIKKEYKPKLFQPKQGDEGLSIEFE